MKKKNRKKILPALLTVLIVLSVAAIVYVVQFAEKEIPAGRKMITAGREQTRPGAAAEKAGAQAPSGPAVSDAREGKKPEAAGAKDVAGEKTKGKTVVAKIIPPGMVQKQIAIIIDDIGHDMKLVHDLLSINEEITFAILPFVAHSRQAAETLHKAGRETLLHLPMEPLSYPKEKPGDGALFTDMSHEELIEQLNKNLDCVPYISGVNNHMGSRFMADEDKLTVIFRQLKKRNLFFIDSRTTGKSKADVASGKVRLKIASRRIFLDNERDYAKIYQILMNAAEGDASRTPMIIIGHPYPETIRVLRDASGVLRQKGVEIVPVSKLLGPAVS